MRICGIGRVRRAVRRLRNLRAPGGVVLLYHRVAEVGSDPWSLCVTPRRFAEQLEVLRERAQPTRLRHLSRALKDGERSDRPVAVTFDDGYADNFYNAKPLLERHDVPATFFLTAGYVDCEHEFWWDELERLLLQPGALPATLRLSINGSVYRWELGEAANYGEDEYRRYRRWRIGDDEPGSRHSLYRSLHQLLQPLDEDERRKVLDELLSWSGADPVSRPNYWPLSSAQVSALGESIEVGAHTVTHPFLPALPPAAQWDEIRHSKARLEEITGSPVTSFAYPYGDYTAETAALVREAGFARACSTETDTVWRRTDPFRLPRVEVQDWDGEEFARRLSKWLESREASRRSLAS